MAFLKFRKAKKSKSGNDSEPVSHRAGRAQESGQEQRLRARHRLIGAVVLVFAAIIVFPLLFDTEPRPAVVDAPVVIADAGQGAEVPAADAKNTEGEQGDTVETKQAEEADTEKLASGPVSTGTLETGGPDEDANIDLDATLDALDDVDLPAAAGETSATRSKVRVAPRSTTDSDSSSARERAATSKPEVGDGDAQVVAEKKRDAEARRAMAALQGQAKATAPAAAPAAQQKGRFAVQVGAFSQERQVRSVRQKLDGAGFKSFTQAIETGAGPRTRVRVGPYSSRDDADRARAALEKAGLPGQVVAL